MAKTKTKPTGRPKGTTRAAKGKRAEVSTVRVDKGTVKTLQYEFGSLGNALYFVAQGILAFRKKHGLTSDEEDSLRADPGDELGYRDLVVIREALWHHVDAWRGDDKVVAPFVAVIRKLDALLFGSETFYGDLPPVGPRERERKRRRKRRVRQKHPGVAPAYYISAKTRAAGADNVKPPPKPPKDRKPRRTVCGTCGGTKRHAVDCEMRDYRLLEGETRTLPKEEPPKGPISAVMNSPEESENP